MSPQPSPTTSDARRGTDHPTLFVFENEAVAQTRFPRRHRTRQRNIVLTARGLENFGPELLCGRRLKAAQLFWPVSPRVLGLIAGAILGAGGDPKVDIHSPGDPAALPQPETP